MGHGTTCAQQRQWGSTTFKIPQRTGRCWQRPQAVIPRGPQASIPTTLSQHIYTNFFHKQPLMATCLRANSFRQGEPVRPRGKRLMASNFNQQAFAFASRPSQFARWYHLNVISKRLRLHHIFWLAVVAFVCFCSLSVVLKWFDCILKIWQVQYTVPSVSDLQDSLLVNLSKTFGDWCQFVWPGRFLYWERHAQLPDHYWKHMHMQHMHMYVYAYVCVPSPCTSFWKQKTLLGCQEQDSCW